MDVHLSHGERLVLMDRKAEQGAGAGHMIFRRVFTEILQRRNRLRALLNLIKNDQHIPGCDAFTSEQAQVEDDSLYIIILIKQRVQSFRFFKVEIDIISVLLPSELLQDIGFPALANALQHQRLSIRLVFPCQQF